MSADLAVGVQIWSAVKPSFDFADKTRGNVDWKWKGGEVECGL